jgi:hypothetical protein
LPIERYVAVHDGHPVLTVSGTPQQGSPSVVVADRRPKIAGEPWAPSPPLADAPVTLKGETFVSRSDTGRTAAVPSAE